MAEKQKTLADYKATWKRIKEDPRKWLDKHVKMQCTSKLPEAGDGVYDIGSTVRAANNYRTFHQVVDEANRQVARVCLEKFVEVEQRLPKSGEQFNCTVFWNVEFLKQGRDATISIVGRIIPKV